MILKLNTNLIKIFSGTYSSFWEIQEYNEEGTEEVNVDFKFADFMKSIAEAYSSNEKTILAELNIDWIKSIHFTGKTHSPSYYNFETDTLDFNLVIDKKKMIEQVLKLNGEVKFEEYLHEKFTGGDGFISFTPNNYTDILNEIQKDGDERDQAISAVISYLAGSETLDNTEMLVLDDWRSQGYYGLDYTIEE